MIRGHQFFPAIGSLFCVKGRVMVALGTDGYRLSTKQKKKRGGGDKRIAALWRSAGHRAGLTSFLRLQRLWSPLKGESEWRGAPRSPAPRENREWRTARVPTRPGFARVWAARPWGSPESWSRGTAGRRWAGRGRLASSRPLAIREQVDPGRSGRMARPTPGSRARRLGREKPGWGCPAPDKGPARRSPAGATARFKAFGRAQPPQAGRAGGPEPPQTSQPRAREEGAPLPVRP